METQVRPRLEQYEKKACKPKTEKKKNDKGLSKKAERQLRRMKRKLREVRRSADARMDAFDAHCRHLDDELTELRKVNRRRDIRDGLNRKLTRLAAEREGAHRE